jgi:glycerol-3-phosphate responsive antiterminator
MNKFPNCESISVLLMVMVPVASKIILIAKGSIGLEELEDPLIALGLVSTREEVEKIIKDVDNNGTN